MAVQHVFIVLCVCAAGAAYTVDPLSSALGVEVVGLDLRSPLDGPTVEAISALLDEHLVVCFRNQGSLSPEEQIKEHRLTRALCSEDGTLHHEFMRFINGEDDFNGDLCELPRLQQLRGRCKLLSAIEREIEAKHKTTREKGSLATNVGGAFMSIAVREPEIVEYLDSSPGNLSTLASAIEQARTGYGVLSTLGLLQHPTVAKHYKGRHEN